MVRLTLVMVLLMNCGVGISAAAKSDPPVPPGRDPGGWPIAILCNGIDYTDNRLAARIARDGEGEIIGFDFAEDDRRPYSESPLPTADQTAIDVLLAEGQAVTLIPVRADFNDAESVARAINYVSQTPAKIVFVMGRVWTKEDVDFLNAAGRRYPDLLIITPAFSDIKPAANIIRVATVDHVSKTLPVVDADMATPVQGDASNVVAAARIAALAIRLQASHSQLSSVEMKQKIVDLAKIPKIEDGVNTVHGTIHRPKRPFWLE